MGLIINILLLQELIKFFKLLKFNIDYIKLNSI